MTATPLSPSTLRSLNTNTVPPQTCPRTNLSMTKYQKAEAPTIATSAMTMLSEKFCQLNATPLKLNSLKSSPPWSLHPLPLLPHPLLLLGNGGRQRILGYPMVLPLHTEGGRSPVRSKLNLPLSRLQKLLLSGLCHCRMTHPCRCRRASQKMTTAQSLSSL